MIEAIKRFFRFIFSCFFQTPEQSALAPEETETDSLLDSNTTQAAIEIVDDQSQQSLSRKTSTANIQAILAEEDNQVAPITEDETPLPLTDTEKEIILTAAATKDFDYNAYIESLGKRKHNEVSELIFNAVKTRFANITNDVAEIVRTATSNAHNSTDASAQLSRAHQLSDSWKSLSREILSTKCAAEKSIAYRCDQLKDVSNDASINKLIHSIKRCFASCKKMLGISLFSRESLNAQKEQDTRSKAENAANDEREARKNNPLNGIKGYKMPEDDGEDSEDAEIVHQASRFLKQAQ